MGWRISIEAYRERHLDVWDNDQVERYEGWIRQITSEDQLACKADFLEHVPTFQSNVSILDIGAGTGAMSEILVQIPNTSITALEPNTRMAKVLKQKPSLREVSIVEGFCDSVLDEDLFPIGSFDMIVARQVVNSLYDPITAFRNWNRWLIPGGTLAIIEGLYNREAWSGAQADEVDISPLAACRSLATIPYLLESVGYIVQHVGLMERMNRCSSTKTPRYLVVAKA